MNIAEYALCSGVVLLGMDAINASGDVTDAQCAERQTK